MQDFKVKKVETYRSIKTYDHDVGLSCCFRNWQATHSHCRLVHGYALAFRLVFATTQLDKHGWCYDLGGLKLVKSWLAETFDHTMMVELSDPELPRFELLARDGLVDLRVIPSVGCEGFAKYVHDYVANFIREQTGGRVWLESVEVKEHGGNSAIYSRC